jgi:Flp pilus assembly protein TadD
MLEAATTPMGKTARLRKMRSAPDAAPLAGGRRAAPRLPAPLLIGAGLIVVAVFVVFAQVGSFPFQHVDDPEYVTGNPQVLRGLTTESVRWAFTGTAAGYWLPITFLSHMADVEMFGMDAGGHHMVNVVVHAAAGVLLFLAFTSTTESVGRSLLVALLFAIHPLRVESVAWVAERKDVLTSLFWCGGMIAWGAWSRRPSRGRYLLVFLLFAAGLMAKPMMITFPFALLLLDVWPLRRLEKGGWRRLIVEKIPLFALIPLFAWATVAAQRSWGAVRTLDEMPLLLRFGNAIVSYAKYLGATLWPSSLSIFYPWERPRPLAVLAALLLLGALTALAIRFRRSRPFLLVGWLWFLGTLVPVIGIVQAGDQAMADRFTYLPHIGVFVALVWGLSELADRVAIPEGVRIAAAGAAVLTLMFVSHGYTKTFSSSVSAWENALAVAERPTADMHLRLAIAYSQSGRIPEALEAHRKVIEMDPESFVARFAHYETLNAAGDFAGAASELEAAARIDPTVSGIHNNLGNVYDKLGDEEPAVAAYREALRLEPGLGEAHMSLATILSRRGDSRGAVEHYGRALELEPSSIEARVYLGLALWNAGDRARSLAELERAGALDPAAANGFVTKALRMPPHEANLEHVLRNLRAQT